MRQTIQMAAILACAGLFVIQAGCGGSDDPSDPGGGTSCSIDITFPATGANYRTGQTLNLRWNAAGGGDVRISLVKAGVEQAEIAAAEDNDGFYSWTVSTMGATSGADFGLAVTHTASDCADTLALTLTNTAGCAFTPTFLPAAYPARTDTVQAGDDYEITWESENTTGSVDIELWYFTGVQHVNVAPLAIGTPDDGAFLWEDVDSYHFGTSNNFYVRIADVAVAGCEASSGYFRLVDPVICEIDIHEPDAASEYDEGEQMLIRFTGMNDTGAMDFYLYEGMENLVEYIAYDVPTADGQYTWTIAIPDGYAGSETFFRVKAADADDAYCFVFSQSFTIHLAQ